MSADEPGQRTRELVQKLGDCTAPAELRSICDELVELIRDRSAMPALTADDGEATTLETLSRHVDEDESVVLSLVRLIRAQLDVGRAAVRGKLVRLGVLPVLLRVLRAHRGGRRAIVINTLRSLLVVIGKDEGAVSMLKAETTHTVLIRMMHTHAGHADISLALLLLLQRIAALNAYEVLYHLSFHSGLRPLVSLIYKYRESASHARSAAVLLHECGGGEQFHDMLVRAGVVVALVATAREHTNRPSLVLLLLRLLRSLSRHRQFITCKGATLLNTVLRRLAHRTTATTPTGKTLCALVFQVACDLNLPVLYLNRIDQALPIPPLSEAAEQEMSTMRDAGDSEGSDFEGDAVVGRKVRVAAAALAQPGTEASTGERMDSDHGVLKSALQYLRERRASMSSVGSGHGVTGDSPMPSPRDAGSQGEPDLVPGAAVGPSTASRPAHQPQPRAPRLGHRQREWRSPAWVRTWLLDQLHWEELFPEWDAVQARELVSEVQGQALDHVASLVGDTGRSQDVQEAMPANTPGPGLFMYAVPPVLLPSPLPPTEAARAYSQDVALAAEAGFNMLGWSQQGGAAFSSGDTTTRTPASPPLAAEDTRASAPIRIDVSIPQPSLCNSYELPLSAVAGAFAPGEQPQGEGATLDQPAGTDGSGPRLTPPPQSKSATPPPAVPPFELTVDQLGQISTAFAYLAVDTRCAHNWFDVNSASAALVPGSLQDRLVQASAWASPTRSLGDQQFPVRSRNDGCPATIKCESTLPVFISAGLTTEAAQDAARALAIAFAQGGAALVHHAAALEQQRGFPFREAARAVAGVFDSDGSSGGVTRAVIQPVPTPPVTAARAGKGDALGTRVTWRAVAPSPMGGGIDWPAGADAEGIEWAHFGLANCASVMPAASSATVGGTTGAKGADPGSSMQQVAPASGVGATEGDVAGVGHHPSGSSVTGRIGRLSALKDHTKAADHDAESMGCAETRALGSSPGSPGLSVPAWASATRVDQATAAAAAAQEAVWGCAATAAVHGRDELPRLLCPPITLDTAMSVAPLLPARGRLVRRHSVTTGDAPLQATRSRSGVAASGESASAAESALFETPGADIGPQPGSPLSTPQMQSHLPLPPRRVPVLGLVSRSSSTGMASSMDGPSPPPVTAGRGPTTPAKSGWQPMQLPPALRALLSTCDGGPLAALARISRLHRGAACATDDPTFSELGDDDTSSSRSVSLSVQMGPGFASALAEVTGLSRALISGLGVAAAVAPGGAFASTGTPSGSSSPSVQPAAGPSRFQPQEASSILPHMLLAGEGAAFLPRMSAAAIVARTLLLASESASHPSAKLALRHCADVIVRLLRGQHCVAQSVAHVRSTAASAAVLREARRLVSTGAVRELRAGERARLKRAWKNIVGSARKPKGNGASKTDELEESSEADEDGDCVEREGGSDVDDDDDDDDGDDGDNDNGGDGYGEAEDEDQDEEPDREDDGGGDGGPGAGAIDVACNARAEGSVATHEQRDDTEAGGGGETNGDDPTHLDGHLARENRDGAAADPAQRVAKSGARTPASKRTARPKGSSGGFGRQVPAGRKGAHRSSHQPAALVHLPEHVPGASVEDSAVLLAALRAHRARVAGAAVRACPAVIRARARIGVALAFLRLPAGSKRIQLGDLVYDALHTPHSAFWNATPQPPLSALHERHPLLGSAFVHPEDGPWGLGGAPSTAATGSGLGASGSRQPQVADTTPLVNAVQHVLGGGPRERHLGSWACEPALWEARARASSPGQALFAPPTSVAEPGKTGESSKDSKGRLRRRVSSEVGAATDPDRAMQRRGSVDGGAKLPSGDAARRSTMMPDTGSGPSGRFGPEHLAPFATSMLGRAHTGPVHPAGRASVAVARPTMVVCSEFDDQHVLVSSCVGFSVPDRDPTHVITNPARAWGPDVCSVFGGALASLASTQAAPTSDHFGPPAMEPPVPPSEEQLPPLRFESRFESGNLSQALRVGWAEYDLVMCNDAHARCYTQWFFFAVRGAIPGVPYRFNVVNCEKAGSLCSSGMKPLMYSCRGARESGAWWVRAGEEIVYFRNWRRKFRKAGRAASPCFTLSFVLRFPYAEDIVYIAYCHPYTASQMWHDVRRALALPSARTTARLSVLCTTLSGARCPLITITSPAGGPAAVARRAYVVLTARVHPGETPASWIMRGVLHFLLSSHPVAEELRRSYVFKVVPMLNPDGVACGNYRFNLAGLDMNRAYSLPQRVATERCPPIAALRQLLAGLRFLGRRVALFCDLHAHSRKHGYFMFGCTTGLPGAPEKLLPNLMARKDPRFALHNCHWETTRDKESCGRVCAFSTFSIPCSYTLEMSFCGPDDTRNRRGSRGTQFTTNEMQHAGRVLLEALHALDPSSEIPRLRQGNTFSAPPSNVPSAAEAQSVVGAVSVTSVLQAAGGADSLPAAAGTTGPSTAFHRGSRSGSGLGATKAQHREREPFSMSGPSYQTGAAKVHTFTVSPGMTAVGESVGGSGVAAAAQPPSKPSGPSTPRGNRPPPGQPAPSSDDASSSGLQPAPVQGTAPLKGPPGGLSKGKRAGKSGVPRKAGAKAAKRDKERGKSKAKGAKKPGATPSVEGDTGGAHSTDGRAAAGGSAATAHGLIPSGAVFSNRQAVYTLPDEPEGEDATAGGPRARGSDWESLSSLADMLASDDEDDFDDDEELRAEEEGDRNHEGGMKLSPEQRDREPMLGAGRGAQRRVQARGQRHMGGVDDEDDVGFSDGDAHSGDAQGLHAEPAEGSLPAYLLDLAAEQYHTSEPPTRFDVAAEDLELVDSHPFGDWVGAQDGAPAATRDGYVAEAASMTHERSVQLVPSPIVAPSGASVLLSRAMQRVHMRSRGGLRVEDVEEGMHTPLSDGGSTPTAVVALTSQCGGSRPASAAATRASALRHDSRSLEGGVVDDDDDAEDEGERLEAAEDEEAEAVIRAVFHLPLHAPEASRSSVHVPPLQLPTATAGISSCASSAGTPLGTVELESQMHGSSRPQHSARVAPFQASGDEGSRLARLSHEADSDAQSKPQPRRRQVSSAHTRADAAYAAVGGRQAGMQASGGHTHGSLHRPNTVESDSLDQLSSAATLGPTASAAAAVRIALAATMAIMPRAHADDEASRRGDVHSAAAASSVLSLDRRESASHLLVPRDDDGDPLGHPHPVSQLRSAGSGILAGQTDQVHGNRPLHDGSHLPEVPPPQGLLSSGQTLSSRRARPPLSLLPQVTGSGHSTHSITPHSMLHNPSVHRADSPGAAAGSRALSTQQPFTVTAQTQALPTHSLSLELPSALEVSPRLTPSSFSGVGQGPAVNRQGPGARHVQGSVARPQPPRAHPSGQGYEAGQTLLRDRDRAGVRVGNMLGVTGQASATAGSSQGDHTSSVHSLATSGLHGRVSGSPGATLGRQGSGGTRTQASSIPVGALSQPAPAIGDNNASAALATPTPRPLRAAAAAVIGSSTPHERPPLPVTPRVSSPWSAAAQTPRNTSNSTSANSQVPSHSGSQLSKFR